MSAELKTVHSKDVLLEVQNLKKWFPVRGGLLRRVKNHVKAVDGVSFFVRRGETLGLVGESGCGKSTTARTILRLEEPTEGTVIFDGKKVFEIEKEELRHLRRDMQIVFQDPYSSLNPRLTIAQIIGEPLLVHGIGTKEEREKRVRELLEIVGLASYHMRRYPHEFSGGQRQRIGIARALALNPKLIVCDEPVSALDVSIQSQILNLLEDLQAEFGLTYLFIAHNLSVVKHISDRVGVMYLGKMVELAGSDELYANPLHPYTRSLLSAIPQPNPRLKKERIILKGDVPSPINPPSGCRFHTRCPEATEICKQRDPEWRELLPDHFVACHHARR